MQRSYKLISVFCGLLLALTFIGCEEASQENEPQIVQNDGPTIKWLLARNQEIKGSVYVGELRGNDSLTLKFKGLKRKPLFSEVYSRTYPSSWRVQICHNNKFTSCGYYKVKSKCEAKYRDFNGFNESLVSLEDDFAQRVKVFIGEKEILLSSFRLEFQENTLIATISVDDSMLENGQKLVVQRIGNDSNAKLKVGFVEFGNCKGRGRHDFKTSAPLGSELILIRDQYEFFLDAYLEYDSYE
jgi:hypothetical protein